jgi:hypothetical protein
MFRVPITAVAQKRTIRPLFAVTQATPYPGFLDAAWDRSKDIYPGMVMTKLADEVFTLADSDTKKPWGLSALFVAPTLGVDEVRSAGTNNFTVWVGDGQATFEILAPAFDTTADWSQAGTGARKMLGYTLAAHAQPGKLSPIGGANVSTSAVAELVSVSGTNKIIVRLNRVA